MVEYNTEHMAAQQAMLETAVAEMRAAIVEQSKHIAGLEDIISQRMDAIEASLVLATACVLLQHTCMLCADIFQPTGAGVVLLPLLRGPLRTC